jgi:hypothetical protein
MASRTSSGASKRKRKRKPVRREPALRPGKQERPAHRAIFLTKWADPEWRAWMLSRRSTTHVQKGNTYNTGVPWGMTKAQAVDMWINARLSAKETILDLKMAGQLDDMDPRGEEALETALTVMRSEISPREKLQAASLVLTYTKSKPAAVVRATVDTAEAWLAALAKDDGDEDEAAGDA